MNVGAAERRGRDAVQRDISAVAAACHAGGAILKVFSKPALLTDEELKRSCLPSLR